MILIKNKQRKTTINQKEIKSKIEKILKHLDYTNFDIGIWFTTNQTIKKYNQKYRNKNKATDVLSFPFHEKIQPGRKITVKANEDKNLGDIIISLERAKKDAFELKKTFKEHLMILIIHGICHLLGYDHQTEKEFKIMQKKELELLKLIK
ncbi:MAG: rRNA maturation RNase YbeY [bacterium]